jgi:hypothetical protein
VDDPSEEIATWSLSVVPLRVGSGTRIKILDSFSRMCPVVSTSLGAYGLDVDNEKHLLIRDKAHEFGDACIKLLEQSNIADSLVKEGWMLLKQKYTWASARPTVESVIGRCLSR